MRREARLTQIFFYHNAADRIAASAALISKAFAQHKTLVVYAPEPELAAAIDRHLWTHPPGGFVPHVRADSPLAAQTPILIAQTLDAADALAHSERLFNLANDVPSGFSRFTSVIEVVGQDADERQASRQRVKFYKDRGYEIKYIDLAENS